MKKYSIHIILAVVIIILAVAIGGMCFNKQESTAVNNSVETSESVETSTPEPSSTTPELTEVPHEHVYTETITTEASCEEDGLKTFTCECGDAYTEVIIATGHVFENYVYNEDATYFDDGTQTAICIGCGITDTQIAVGSMRKYTFTPMEDTIMYVQQTVNVRNLPCTDGEKVYSLSTNEAVMVTAQCNETGWYEIWIGGNPRYVSNNYLGTSQVVVAEKDFNTPEIDNFDPWQGDGTFEFSESHGDGGELIDNPNFMMGDGSGNYYDQYGNLVTP